MDKDLQIGDLGIFSGRNEKKVKVLKINDKTVTYLIIDENKIKYIYTEDFKKKFIPENKVKTVLKENPENKEIKKTKDFSEKENTKKIEKPTFSIVGVYKSELGVEENEDLTKENLLGYRIRYNKEPNRYFGYVEYDKNDLEGVKKRLQYIIDREQKEREYRKIKDAENKIKREQNKIIEQEKLEAANKEIIKKPSYLMTLSEYENKVVPILIQYQKFLRKNSKYLESADYGGIYQYTYPELEEDVENKTVKGFKFANAYIGNPLAKFKASHYPSDEIVAENKSFKNKLLNFFTEKEIFSELSKDEVKSNKRAVRRAIDDDTYKKLLESGELTESELEVIARSVDVTMPKKVYSVENVKAKEMREKFQKLLAGLPIINQEKLNELIESIKIDFKPLEEELFIEEKAKYIEKFQDLVSKDKVYVATLDGTFQIWRELFSYDKVQYAKIKTGRFRRNPYTKQEEEVLEEKAYVTNLKFKPDWETTFDKFLKEYISTLKYSFINAIINNFDRITKPIVDFVKLRIIRGYKGFEGVYRFIFDDGSYFDFKAEAIRAGGYNIQILHLRYITNFENITLADGSKVKGYSNLIENFNVKKMEKGGLTHDDMKNKTDKYKGMLKKPSSLLKISQMHKVPMFFLQSQLIKGIKVESEHTNREVVAKIIALHHLEEDPSYYIKLEKVEGKMADGGELSLEPRVGDIADFGEGLEKITRIVKTPKGDEYIEAVAIDGSSDRRNLYPKKEWNQILENQEQYQKLNKEREADRNEINLLIKEKQDLEQARIAEYNDIDGFGDNLTPMKKGKALQFLNKKVFLKDGRSIRQGIIKKELKEIAKKDWYIKPFNGVDKIRYKEGEDTFIAPEYLQKKISMEYLEYLKKNKKMAKGGEIDPDNKSIKSAMTHKAGSAGGLLVGNRHSEGGIKAINKSTNTPIEMEGGEVVITRNAVSDNSKREFEGQMLTNREILSKINESGGGVSFASGGKVPSSCKCSGKSYKYGGENITDYDIVKRINSKY